MKKLLKEYLSQYYKGRIKRTQLERRLKNIKEEMSTPIERDTASFVYRMSEIETKIENQKSQIEKALLKVMDIMDFLEENSTERIILELRFIDCRNWKSIEHEMHLSRSSLFAYQDKALEKLLTFKKVKAILIEYKKTLKKI